MKMGYLTSKNNEQNIPKQPLNNIVMEIGIVNTVVILLLCVFNKWNENKLELIYI